MSDVYSALATQSGLIWYVDPATATLQFRLADSVAAPFTLTYDKVLFGTGTSPTMKLGQSRNTYRNRQIVKMSPTAIPPSSAVFPGDGVTTAFTLPFYAQQALGATDGSFGVLKGTYKGSAGQAQSTANFSATGPINAGDTATVNLTGGGSRVYTFANTLDNTVQGQVVAGAASAANITRAGNVISGALNSGTSLTVTLPNPTVAGNFLVATVSSSALSGLQNADIWVISDNKGNTWKTAANMNLQLDRVPIIFYCDHLAGAGSGHTVTVNQAPLTGNSFVVTVAEYSGTGFGYVDVGSETSATGTTSVGSGANITPTAGVNILMIASVDYDSNTPTPTVGGGWSVVDALANTPVQPLPPDGGPDCQSRIRHLPLIATTPGSQKTPKLCSSVSVDQCSVRTRSAHGGGEQRRVRKSGFGDQRRRCGDGCSHASSGMHGRKHAGADRGLPRAVWSRRGEGQ